MKKLVQSLLILLCINNVSAHPNENTINAIIGDISFVHQFGQTPLESTNELLRIQTHLSYVEELLRSKDVSHLSSQQKMKRALVLNFLHEYKVNGVFPTNYDYPERRPCFIDQDGNICAVGYLVAKTSGIRVAENINAAHKYDYLLDMKSEVLTAWAQEYGLTLQECGMIQPTYGPVGSYEAPVKSSYGISSGLLGGLNAGITVMNMSSKNGNIKNFSYMGFVSGTAQIILGLTNIKKHQIEYYINGPTRTISYKQQNNLSYINIAAGTATVFTSVINFYLNKTIKDKRNTVNLYNYQGADNKMTTGLAFSRSL